MKTPTLEERAADLEELSNGIVAPGKWATVTFVVPDKLEKIREQINDFFELVNLALEIVNLTLEFAKAFLTAYLNPLDLIIQAILDEIRALAEDIQQLGIYITHDLALFNDWPPLDLEGGFSAYERRMVGRLTDRGDPTRPNVSSRFSVFSLFLYLSVDPTDVYRLYELVMTLVGLFTGGKTKPLRFNLPVPVIRDVFYGNDAISIFNPRTIKDALTDFDGLPPNRFKVAWQVNPGANYPFNPVSKAAPDGFIVTVSTRPEGLGAYFSRAKNNAPAQDGKKGKAQPREYGKIMDTARGHVVLHGGTALMKFPANDLGFNQAIEAGHWKDGAAAIYGQFDPASPEVIPFEMLAKSGASQELGEAFDGKGSDYYIQRAFRVSATGTAFEWASGTFTFALGGDDLPQKISVAKLADGSMEVTPQGRASTYYVRVAAVPKDADPKLDLLDAANNRWLLGQPWVVPAQRIGGFSEAHPITITGDNSRAFLQLLKTSIKLLLLTRADLPHIDTAEGSVIEHAKMHRTVVQGFVLKECGLESSRPLLERMFPDGYRAWVEKTDPTSQVFMRELEEIASLWANRMFDAIGSNPELESMVYEATPALRETKLWEVVKPLDQGGNIQSVSLGDLIPALPNLGENLLTSSGRGIQSMASIAYTTVEGGLSHTLTLQDYLEGEPVPGFIGLARNPWSIGLAEDVVQQLRWRSDVWTGRKPHFGEQTSKERGDPFGPSGPVTRTETKAETDKLIAGMVPGMQHLFKHFIREDGTLLVPQEEATAIEILTGSGETYGSADRSPVFWSVTSGMSDFGDVVLVDGHDWIAPRAMIYYARTLLAEYEGGVLMREASFVLTMASAAVSRPKGDGEWIAIRAFDAFPELEYFFDALADWLEAVANAIKSVVDALVGYIEFVQAQIVRLQQLLRMINAFIQSFLNLRVQIPRLSALGLLSSGTDGVVADLMNAEEKPYDSQLAFGAGVALVIPFAPTFLVDLFMLLFPGDPDKTRVVGVPATISREDAPAGDEAPSDEPDVL